MSYYRNPSPLELVYLPLNTPTHSPLVMEIVIEGSGNLDLDLWKKAANTAAQANPGYHLKLAGTWAFKHWDDAGPLPKVIKIETDWDGMSSEGAPHAGDPIDLRNEPAVEIILMDGPIQRVLFRVHHCIADGQALFHWIREVYRCLRGEQPLGSNGKETDWEIAQRFEHPERIVREGDCLPVSPKSTNVGERGCGWLRMDWKGNQSKIVPKLILASSRVAKHFNGEGRRVFRVPSDLRRLLDKDAPFTTSNATGAIDLELNDDSTIDSIREAIIKGQQEKIDLSVFSDKLKFVRWLPSRLFKTNPKHLRAVHEKGLYGMSGTVSVLGRMKMEDYSCPDFSASKVHSLPIAFEYRPLFLCVSINPAEITASIGMPKALANQEQLLEVRERLMWELDQL